jgi:uncharacterized repeat protein (TIGR03943 family)
MTLGTQNMLVLFIGLLVIRLVVTKGHLSYVRPGLGLLLLIAGGVMTVVSGITLWTAAEGSLRRKEIHPGHGRGAGWLLILPLFALMVVEPAPLGAYAAGFRSAQIPTVEADADFGPLPAAEEGAVALPLTRFAARALYGEPEDLEDVPVRLTGFVASEPAVPDGFALTRFVVGCCAADAVPVQVFVHGAGPAPPADTWLEVDGTWQPPSEPISPDRIQLAKVHLNALSMRVVEQPEAPYETAF